MGTTVLQDGYLVTTYDSKHVVKELPPNPEDVPQIVNRPILHRIQLIELRQTRALREWILTGNKTALQKIDDEIAALRALLV